MSKKYYAVREGRESGIYGTWSECRSQTNGYSGGEFKSFDTHQEAQQYMNGGGGGGSSSSSSSGGGGGYSYSSSSSSRSLPPIRTATTSTNGRSTSCPQTGGQTQRLRMYTDGSCHGNGYSGAQAGIGVHYPDHPEYDISEPLAGRPTNNRAEITAAARGIELAKQRGYNSVEVNTDSDFLIRSATDWSYGWRNNGWKKSDGTDVVNKEEFKRLDAAAENMDVIYNKVDAHRGNAGNEKADQLANKGSRRNNSS
ncbi:ribonuclease H1-like [Oppia nitens]|uniref:ribonuclease H1-like n=1 Tax=Oppia nitens TaxID=1686743 RepID=UPI0023DB3812|nr:ribonuclease H1-like [Oppia nitens]